MKQLPYKMGLYKDYLHQSLQIIYRKQSDIFLVPDPTAVLQM